MNSGIIEQAKDFARVCGRYFSVRFQLIRLEGKEAAAHTVKLLVILAVMLVFAAIAWLFICIGLAALLAECFTKHPWLWASLIIAGAHALVAGILAMAFRQQASTPLFPLTTQELKKDQEWLNQQTKPRS